MSNTLIFKVEPQPLYIQFNGALGAPIGVLKESNGRIEFTGNADKAAQVFFEHMDAELQKRIQLLAARQKGLPEEVQEFLSLVMSGTNQGLRKRALDILKKYADEM